MRAINSHVILRPYNHEERNQFGLIIQRSDSAKSPLMQVVAASVDAPFKEGDVVVVQAKSKAVQIEIDGELMYATKLDSIGAILENTDAT
jgi:co-chaperonin GroES (HSP10)